MAQEREVEGDLFLQDMGEGLGFRAGTFDGAISVSALQWLCNADRKTQHPPRRLYRFFSSLYASLVGLECDISLLQIKAISVVLYWCSVCVLYWMSVCLIVSDQRC